MEDDVNNPTYLTSVDRIAFQTSLQVIQAINSLNQLTEKFWQVWQSQYLTSLREQHQRDVGKKRESCLEPEIGKLYR